MAQAAFEELVKSRHSVRKFKPDPVPEETLKAIVQTATMTPSWCNHQPWCVTIATGESMKTIQKEYLKLNQEKAEYRPDVPTLHRKDVSDLSKKAMEEFFGQVGALADPQFEIGNANIFDCPAVAYLTLPKGYNPYSLLDIGAFYMTLMLAARAHGVDSIPAAATINYGDVLHRVLSIPDDQVIVIGVALGYGTDDKINKFVPKRLPLSDILTIKN